MEKAVWFYMVGKQKEGPVSHTELQDMLDRGDINRETKVWNDSMSSWVSISEVENFTVSVPNDPPIAVVERGETYPHESDPDYVKPRVWVRFWARMIDYSLFALTIGFFIGYFHVHFAQVQSFMGMLIIFIWVFVETCLISTWGTTPGKWMMKIAIRGYNKKRLTFSNALNRSFSVWWIGMGAGFPIVTFITMIVGAVKLSNNGVTTWDRRNEYHIIHGKVGVLRTLIVVAYFIFYFWLISWGQIQIANAS